MAGFAGMAHAAFRLRKADDEAVRRKVRAHLVERMGRLRGLPQKLGQMLSFSWEGDSAAVNDYAALQDAAPPLPLETLLPAVEQAWGRPATDVVREISPRGHAASLGQVHRAVLHDSRVVAIKIQYPGIRQAVLDDLKFLGWLGAPLGRLKQDFDFTAYRQVILEDLERELDYGQEAAAQTQCAADHAQTPGVVIPRIIPELSTQTVLVSTWEDGQPWGEVSANWPQALRRDLAQTMLAFFLQSLLKNGRVQADWHPGNVRFRLESGSPRVVMYDFGCTFEPTKTERLALARLLQATLEHGESPWPLFQALGFNMELLEPLADRLPALCEALFEPLTADYPFDFADWNLSERMADILGNDRWNFRIAGPASLIFLMRAFHGVLHYLQGLQAPLRARGLVQQTLSSIAGEMKYLELPRAANKPDFHGLARRMRINVSRGGKTTVELAQPASAIERLADLLEPALVERIAAQGIALREIVAETRRRGYAPGPVFACETEEKAIRVWLE